MRQGWVEKFEEQRDAIENSPQSWWDNEAPIDKTDVGVIAAFLRDLQQEIVDFRDADMRDWSPSEIESHSKSIYKLVRLLADTYSDDQVQFAMNVLDGKY